MKEFIESKIGVVYAFIHLANGLVCTDNSANRSLKLLTCLGMAAWYVRLLASGPA